MKTIRYNTFETNSSSTHSITVIDRDDYQKWYAEKLFIFKNGEVCTVKDAYEFLKRNHYYHGPCDYYKLEEFIFELIEQDSCLHSDSLPLTPGVYDRITQFADTSVKTVTTKRGEELTVLSAYESC